MSNIVTDLPLHEVVLKIMFHQNMEKAAAMAPQDILWHIDNPEISERQVREVLDWLVHHKKVELYLGKYTIDRIEFLEQKKLYEAAYAVGNKGNMSRNNHNYPLGIYINPSSVKQNKYHIYLLVLGVLAFGYFTYTLTEFKQQFEPSKTLATTDQNTIKSIPGRKRLYVSQDESYTEDARNAILYSFIRQNNTNALQVREMNGLQLKLDSIAKAHKGEMQRLQSELQGASERSNALIRQLIVCNLIILASLVFLFLKK